MSSVRGSAGALAATLVAAGACAAPAAVGPPTGSGAPATCTEVALSEWQLAPSSLEAPAGAVCFIVRNDGTVSHDLGLRREGAAADAAEQLFVTRLLAPGGSQTVTWRIAAGRFTAYCDVPGHEAAGMKGTVAAR